MSKKEKLIQRLEDPSPEVRRRASGQIATLPAEESIDLILAAIADDDWRVRKETIETLKEITVSGVLIERLVEGLIQDDNVGFRNAAAEALIWIGEAAVDLLLRRMPALSPGGRKIALEVVGQSGDHRALDALIDGLRDPDDNIMVCAAELLGDQGSAAAQAALVELLDSDDHLLVIAALQSLNRISAKIPRCSLEPLLGQKIYGSEVVLAMGRTEDPQAAEQILSLLPGEPVVVRALELLYAASFDAKVAVKAALGRAGNDVFEALVSMVRDIDGGDRRAAVKCLLWTRRQDSVPVIVELSYVESLYPVILNELADWGEAVVDELQTLLPKLTGRSLASVVNLLAKLMSDETGRANAVLFLTYLNSNDIVVATAAAGAVGRFGDETSIDRLIEMVRDSDSRVRWAAGSALIALAANYGEAVIGKLRMVELKGIAGVDLCRVLGSVGESEDAGLLSAPLNAPEPELRQAALKSLAMLAGERALQSISLAMTDEDAGVQMAAAYSLAQIGSAASETIVSALNTASGPIKAVLVTALGDVGHPEADSVLNSMFEDSSDVVVAAIESMQKLGLPLDKIHDRLLAHRDAEVVKKALLFLRSSVSQNELLELLSHNAWDVRLAAVERLALLDYDASLKDRLRDQLAIEQDDLVRRSIERLLEHFKLSR